MGKNSKCPPCFHGIMFATILREKKCGTDISPLFFYHRASSRVPPRVDEFRNLHILRDIEHWTSFDSETFANSRNYFFVSSKKKIQIYIYIIGLYLYCLEQKLHAIEYRLRIAIYLCMNLFNVEEVDNTFVSSVIRWWFQQRAQLLV